LLTRRRRNDTTNPGAPAIAQRDIELSADGTTLRGWPSTPGNSDGPRPTVVMAHGYSAAGHVLVVGRHRSLGDAVVSQGLMVSGYQNIRRLVRADLLAGFRAQFDADRLARFNGETPAMVPVVAEDQSAQSEYKQAEATQAAAGRALRHLRDGFEQSSSRRRLLARRRRPWPLTDGAGESSGEVSPS